MKIMGIDSKIIKLRKELIEALKDKTGIRSDSDLADVLKCPVCNQIGLDVEGPSNLLIQNKLKGVDLFGPRLPTMVLVCKNCGYCRHFALGPLGLIKN